MRAAVRFSALLALLLAGRAEAHSVGLSFGTYSLEKDGLSAELVFSRREIGDTLPEIDADHDGQLNEAEISAHRDELQSVIIESVVVTVRTATGSAGPRCPGRLERAAPTEQDGLALSARYRCPIGAGLVHVEVGFVDTVPPGHRHIVKASGGGSPLELIIYRAHKGFDLARAATAENAAPAGRSAPAQVGFESAALAPELGLLLLGLLVVLRARRAYGEVLAAFAIGLTAALLAGSLGVFRPSPSFAEVLVRLAIAYLGVEALFAARAAEGRWRLALPIGLIAGFWLAGPAISRDFRGGAAFGYLLGALGAMLLLSALVGAALLALSRNPRIGARLSRAVGVALVCLGLLRIVASALT